MFSKFRLAFSAFVATTLAGPASAFDDQQSWNAWNASAKVADDLTVMTETHLRFTNDVSMLGTVMLRPQITYAASKYHTYTAGYAYARTRAISGAVTHEHRTWQQIGYIGLTLGAWQMSGRTRIEQRYFERRTNTGWRLRQQVRAAAPMTNAIQGLLWNETFVGLNRTSWGQRANFDQTRSFVGVAWKISDAHALEPGALHQRVFRDGPDADNIILSVTLVSKF